MTDWLTDWKELCVECRSHSAKNECKENVEEIQEQWTIVEWHTVSALLIRK